LCNERYPKNCFGVWGVTFKLAIYEMFNLSFPERGDTPQPVFYAYGGDDRISGHPTTVERAYETNEGVLTHPLGIDAVVIVTGFKEFTVANFAP
jgi:hypothetical protein